MAPTTEEEKGNLSEKDEEMMKVSGEKIESEEENKIRKENTKKRYESMYFRDIIKEEEEFESLISKDEEFIEVTQKAFAEYLQRQGLDFDVFYELWRKKMKEEKKVADEVRINGFQKADLTKYLMSAGERLDLLEKNEKENKMEEVEKTRKRIKRTREMYEFMDFREINMEFGQFLDGINGVYSDSAVEDIKQKTLIDIFQRNDLDLDTFIEIRDRKIKEYEEEEEEKKQEAKNFFAGKKEEE